MFKWHKLPIQFHLDNDSNCKTVVHELELLLVFCGEIITGVDSSLFPCALATATNTLNNFPILIFHVFQLLSLPHGCHVIIKRKWSQTITKSRRGFHPFLSYDVVHTMTKFGKSLDKGYFFTSCPKLWSSIGMETLNSCCVPIQIWLHFSDEHLVQHLKYCLIFWDTRC